MGKMNITCSKCNSVYEFTSQKAIMRVKEDFNCEVCGELLYKCNEAKDWNYNIIEKHTIPFDESEGNFLDSKV